MTKTDDRPDCDYCVHSLEDHLKGLLPVPGALVNLGCIKCGCDGKPIDWKREGR